MGIFNKGLQLQQWSEVQGCQTFSFSALQVWVVSWFGFEAIRVSWSELQGVLEGSCSFFWGAGFAGVLLAGKASECRVKGLGFPAHAALPPTFQT